MNQTFLGVDIGGTKTNALIANQKGEVLGFSRAGPGSYEVVGWAGLEATLQAVVTETLQQAGLKPGQIDGAGFGIAGYDWPGELQPHLDALATLGLQCPLEIVNDTIVGLVAGAPDGWGVALVSGTGSNCWGWDRQHRIGRVSGGGETFGEFAGGGDVVRRAIQVINHAWIQRIPSTALTQAFMERTGAASQVDLLEGLYLRRYIVNAADAPLVFQAANAGDEAAQSIVRWAGEELAWLAVSVIRQLNFQQESFDLVLVGSLYDGSPLLLQTLEEKVHQTAPEAKLLRLESPPVVGGVLLGIQAAGLDFHNVRETLIAQVNWLGNGKETGT